MVRYKSGHDVTDNTQKVADTDMPAAASGKITFAFFLCNAMQR